MTKVEIVLDKLASRRGPVRLRPGRFAFRETTVTVDAGARTVRTVWSDGHELVADGARVDDLDRARAASLGYPGPWEMHAEHDVLHTVVAEALGFRWSLALRQAAGVGDQAAYAALEERAVMLVARALNVGRQILEERRAG